MGFHSEMRRNGLRLVGPAGAPSADIQFLKRDNVGLAAGNYLGNANWVAAKVRTATTVHVIGHQTQNSVPRLQPSCRFIGHISQPNLVWFVPIG